MMVFLMVQVIILLLFVVLIIGEDLSSSERLRHRSQQRYRLPCHIKHPTVKLRNGATIIGTVNRTVDENVSYFSYRGIRYAEPPTGNLRFRPPVPFSGNFTNKTIYATQYGNICTQPLHIAQDTESQGNEDCLFLNIFVPQINHKCPLPVMVWVHGGFFLIGASSLYGPDYLLNDNVIVVTMNYRLGVYGFLNMNDDASPGNYGLKDQIMALRWIHDHIESFGGDKSAITLFGESAGSVSVAYLSQTHQTHGLYHKTIAESGSNLCMWGLERQNREMAFAIGRFLGIFTSNATYLVDELRKVDSIRLNQAALFNDLANVLFSNLLYNLPFAPSMEPELPGAVVTRPMHQAYTEGYYSRVPKIIGFNSREATPFVEMILTFARWYLLRYEIAPIELVPASLNITDAVTLAEVAKLISEHYFGSNPIIQSNETLVQFATDDLFSRPIIEHISLVSQNSNVYFYNFSFESPLGIPGVPVRMGPGVGHGEELYYIWRMAEEPKNLTKPELLTRRRLVRLWTNFAKTSNPTPTNKDLLLEGVTWPKVNPTFGSNQLNVLNIGKNLVPMPYVNPEYIYWKQIFKTYGNPPYSTY